MNNEFASSLSAVFIEKQPSFDCRKDILTAMSSGALSFSWSAAKGSLIMNCESQKLAVELIWQHMDDSFTVAGRELDLELLEIHAIDTDITYDLDRWMMNVEFV